MRAAPRSLLLPAVAVLVAGCGLRPESTAREIPPTPDTRQSTSATPPDGPLAGTESVRLYLVRQDTLEPVLRHVDTPPTVRELVAYLEAGPSHAERAAGYRSALTDTDLVADVQLVGRIAVVGLADSFDLAGRPNDVLAFAEVVCTLALHPSVDGVVFTRDGQRVGIPRDDGSLSEEPLTEADYRGLLSPGG